MPKVRAGASFGDAMRLHADLAMKAATTICDMFNLLPEEYAEAHRRVYEELRLTLAGYDQQRTRERSRLALPSDNN